MSEPDVRSRFALEIPDAFFFHEHTYEGTPKNS